MKNRKNRFERCLQRIDTAFRNFPVTALLSIVGGILLIAFPAQMLSLLIRIIGIALALYGILRILAITVGRMNVAWTFVPILCFLGALTVTVVGFILIVSPSEALRFLTVVTGLYLVFDGAVKLYRLLLSASRFSSRYGIFANTNAERMLLIVLYALTVCAGLWLLLWPGSSLKAVAVIIGASLLLSGLQSGFTYRVAVKKTKKAAPKSGDLYSDQFVDKSK